MDEPPVVPDLVLGSVRSERATPTSQQPPVPLELPYDRQCIVRFPADIAEKVRKVLADAGTTDSTEVIRITIDNELVSGHQFRAFSIAVFEHQRQLKEFNMKGILVDLPTFVESYKTVNSGASITKSSDISQMLICFKLADFVPPYNTEIQTALNLVYPSGLTPPTNLIRQRKFRPPPSKEDVQNLRTAEDTIDSVMSGGALEWVVETEVPESEEIARALNEPDNVWTPTEDILAQLRNAGYVDVNGDIIEDEPMEPARRGGKGFAQLGGGKSISFARKT